MYVSMYNQNLFPAKTKNWHNSTTGKKVPPAHTQQVYSSYCQLYTYTYVEMPHQLFILFLREKNRKDTNKDLWICIFIF